jgi:uridine kinase
MIGDKLVIEQHHTDRAEDISELLEGLIEPRYVLTIAGESGSGKSELAFEIARLLTERDISSGILGQDDYFVFPPKTNHEMRQNNLEQVGPYEVKLDFMDSNLRSFKRGENPIYKPLVVYEENRITTEEMDVSDQVAMVAEGTYTSLLNFADFRVFIDRSYRETLDARKKRARDKFEDFVTDVLEKEHQIISQHKRMADLLIPSEFDRIILMNEKG